MIIISQKIGKNKVHSAQIKKQKPSDLSEGFWNQIKAYIVPKINLARKRSAITVTAISLFLYLPVNTVIRT